MDFVTVTSELTFIAEPASDTIDLSFVTVVSEKTGFSRFIVHLDETVAIETGLITS